MAIPNQPNNSAKSLLTPSWVPLGDAIMDYYNGDINATICIKSTIEGDRVVPVGTFFREKDQFPKIEKDAFKYCKGKTLDVGAGGGPHALYLQKKGLDITGLDISDKAVEVMQKRGLNAVCASIFEYHDSSFDTILMMMNGIGVAGELSALGILLRHLKSILKPGGQILFDSTDIDYVTSFDRALSTLRIPFPEYYGIVHYQLEYKDKKGEIYPWLFIDKKTMKRIAEENGYQFSVLKSRSSQYLGRLTMR